MDGNREKSCFTFFAFLPHYMGFSASLMPCKRQILKRSIDWYQKLLISWHVALYCAVFLFLVRISQARRRKSMEILSKFFRNSFEILSNFYRNLSKFYRHASEILLKFYRNSIEILLKFCRNCKEILSDFYRKSIELLSKFN